RAPGPERGDEQAVVTPRDDAGDGSAGVATEAVGEQPLASDERLDVAGLRSRPRQAPHRGRDHRLARAPPPPHARGSRRPAPAPSSGRGAPPARPAATPPARRGSAGVPSRTRALRPPPPP